MNKQVRMPRNPAVQPVRHVTPIRGGVLQRQCACGRQSSSGGECEACKKKNLQRKATSTPGPAIAPPLVHEVLNSPGRPIDGETRSSLEPRLGHDFSNVRVHADDKAAASARAVNALAYTVGSHVVFGSGQYQSGTVQGQNLLAHELTHVVQQRFQTSTPDRLEIGPRSDPFETEAEAAAVHTSNRDLAPHIAQKSTVQRQGTVATTQALPPTPGFSVNQGEYRKLVQQAVQQMQGRHVEAQTLAPTIKPMLDAMLASVVWMDGQGQQQGGGSAVHQQLPGTPPTSVSLRLVLDDGANSDKLGDFEPASPQNGTMRIFIQKNADVEVLTRTLFHEALHIMVWLANRPSAPDLAQKNNRQTRALNRARNAPEVQLVRNVLDNIAANINPGRKAKGEIAITPAGLNKAAPFLVEETEVRAETKVFDHFLDMQRGMVVGQMTSTSAGQLSRTTTVDQDVDQAMVDKYVFDFSGVFKPGDRALLTPNDQQSIVGLSQILENFYNKEIQRRTAAPGASVQVSKEQVKIPLPPLNP